MYTLHPTHSTYFGGIPRSTLYNVLTTLIKELD